MFKGRTCTGCCGDHTSYIITDDVKCRAYIENMTLCLSCDIGYCYEHIFHNLHIVHYIFSTFHIIYHTDVENSDYPTASCLLTVDGKHTHVQGRQDLKDYLHSGGCIAG